MEKKEAVVPKELEGLDYFSKLLDTRFRIPGTQIRFGLDFIIGLFPYAGDIIGFIFSAGLVLTMARYGASAQVIARMLGNIVLDTVVGSIPIIGDIFDLAYRANRRNYHLLEKHYGEDAYKGSVWKVLLPVLIVLVLVFFLMLWLVFKGLSLVWDFLF